MKKKTGNHGEELAFQKLTEIGYRVIERNWRCERGEIDIVARDGDTLVFIEVKTRRSAVFGVPQEAVDFRKQERLRHLAMQYIHKTNTSASSYRFDVIAVHLHQNKIELLKDAF